MKWHWPEYLIEAAGLGLFMIAASLFSVALFHPASAVVMALPSEWMRRVLMGASMAVTAISLIYNRWGQQSGAHYNPAVTLTFYRLGKVAALDAVGYITAQFVGGCLGMWVAVWSFRPWIGDPHVQYVATIPGRWGSGVAWLAEFLIAFVLMSVVLTVSSKPRVERWTGVCAAFCVFLFIAVEAPFSGMSLNPARTFASAWVGGEWTALWVYFTAPILGMLSAAGCVVHLRGVKGVSCAKLHHRNTQRCIFCEFQARNSSAKTVRNGAGAPLTRI